MEGSIRREKVVPIEQADAIGFGSLSKTEKHNFDFIPFKLPSVAEDEVRIKLLYTGLCHTDILWSNGSWGDFVEIPAVPGHEIVGEVTHVGTKVTEHKVGDKIGYGFIGNCCNNCEHCKAGNDNLCKSAPDVIIFNPHFGGWASHYQGKAAFGHKIPEEIPLNVCPPIFCAGLTVFAPMKRYLKSGMHVAIVGIGGLGHIAVKYGKAMGCKVTAITNSADKVTEIKNLGADNVLLASDLAEAQKQRDIDVIICCISEGSLNEYLKVLKVRGTFVMVGLPELGNDYKIDVHFIVLNEINFVGSLVGNRQDVKECLEFSAKHKCFPIIEEFSFDDFPKAAKRLHYERPRYRCVVKCQSDKYSQFNK